MLHVLPQVYVHDSPTAPGVVTTVQAESPVRIRIQLKHEKQLDKRLKGIHQSLLFDTFNATYENVSIINIRAGVVPATVVVPPAERVVAVVATVRSSFETNRHYLLS